MVNQDNWKEGTSCKNGTERPVVKNYKEGGVTGKEKSKEMTEVKKT